jgi:hypothetical protein
LASSNTNAQTLTIGESWSPASCRSARPSTAATTTVTGKPTFQGEAAAEAKITDARSGAVLAEAVDQRMGGR